ncbi:MAG: electron transfer flavoprotein subunit beta/FixA family protein [Anaerolineales bacterium]|nr:electron transfer flavoprotein subunit beta/FixA family protein [Anaerolineales bacterium]
MKIVVCVKETIDTAATLSLQAGDVFWGDASLIINPWDEFAVETALQLTEEFGGDVVALSVGGSEKNEALKHALAMGCKEAVQLSAPENILKTTSITASMLAEAVQKVGEVDLVFFGRQSTDEETGLTASQTARLLNWPALTQTAKVTSLDIQGQTIEVERLFEDGRQHVKAALPAVVSVVKEICEPRYPSFMGIRKAARAVIPCWDLSDLGLSGIPEAACHSLGLAEPAGRTEAVEMITGDNAAKIAATLVKRLTEEKVL